jgi:hypothetical protein
MIEIVPLCVTIDKPARFTRVIYGGKNRVKTYPILRKDYPHGANIAVNIVRKRYGRDACPTMNSHV